MGLLDRLANSLGYSRRAEPDVAKKHLTQAPYARAVRFGIMPGNPKRGTRILRHFAEANEWVRVAINRRKHAIGQAEWQIIRIDDKDADPDPGLVKEVTELFRFVNSKKESFRSLCDQVIEDLLVLDAGCIEKDRTLGGQIMALWPVDGATIVVDPSWDGSEPDKPRYSQWDNFVHICDLTNDELIYMMHNPRTHSAIGFSPVEGLVRVIEAELYGEEYDFKQLRGAPPGGMLDLGSGVPPDQVEAFREFWAQEIAGSDTVAIVGGGAPLGVDTNQPVAKWTSFQTDNRSAERMAYKTWLAKKIAAAFEMDPMNFNIHEGVNRSTSQTMQGKTDEGLVGLASVFAEYITREIIWDMDPSHRHGFRFDDLTERDEAAQAAIDEKMSNIGVTTPNEIRAREGKEPVAWGDQPWAQAKIQAQSEADLLAAQAAAPDDEGEPNQAKPAKKPPAGKTVAATDDVPFVENGGQRRRRGRTRSAKYDYLDNLGA